jgi:hypothetical protein
MKPPLLLALLVWLSIAAVTVNAVIDLADDGTYFDPPEVVSHPEKEKESAGN